MSCVFTGPLDPGNIVGRNPRVVDVHARCLVLVFQVRDYFLISGHETFSLQSSRDEVGNVQTALQLHSELDREQAAAYTVRLFVCTRVSPMNLFVCVYAQ